MYCNVLDNHQGYSTVALNFEIRELNSNPTGGEIVDLGGIGKFPLNGNSIVLIK